MYSTGTNSCAFELHAGTPDADVPGALVWSDGTESIVDGPSIWPAGLTLTATGGDAKLVMIPAGLLDGVVGTDTFGIEIAFFR